MQIQSGEDALFGHLPETHISMLDLIITHLLMPCHLRLILKSTECAMNDVSSITAVATLTINDIELLTHPTRGAQKQQLRCSRAETASTATRI